VPSSPEGKPRQGKHKRKHFKAVDGFRKCCLDIPAKPQEVLLPAPPSTHFLAAPPPPAPQGLWQNPYSAGRVARPAPHKMPEWLLQEASIAKANEVVSMPSPPTFGHSFGHPRPPSPGGGFGPGVVPGFGPAYGAPLRMYGKRHNEPQRPMRRGKKQLRQLQVQEEETPEQGGSADSAGGVAKEGYLPQLTFDDTQSRAWRESIVNQALCLARESDVPIALLQGFQGKPRAGGMLA